MINSVRNTVLSILNKNNYGYISPSDFNLFATQAQLEIFEEYFSTYNRIINAENMRSSGTGYGDVKKTISEAMEIFLRSDYLIPILTSIGSPTNLYYLPSLTTTGFDYYMINKVVFYKTLKATGSSTSVLSNSLVDSSANFSNSGIEIRDIVLNTTNFSTSSVNSIVNSTTLGLNDNLFNSTLIGYNIYSWRDYSEAEYISNSKIDLLNNSILTSPSFTYPAYAIQGDTLYMYPVADPTGGFPYYFGTVKAHYFRYPKAPKWTYITLSGGEPAFNQSQPDYQDFEIPIEDEYKLVSKICQYCGISIRETEVVQYSMAQEQQQQ